MITITSPSSQDFLISTLDGKEFEGITYHFKKKDGRMKLVFDTEGEGDAAGAAKRAIKATPTGAVLYFQIA